MPRRVTRLPNDREMKPNVTLAAAITEDVRRCIREGLFVKHSFMMRGVLLSGQQIVERVCERFEYLTGVGRSTQNK